MGRYVDEYDEQFNNQGELWRANADRAMNGKRGRAVLRELRLALLALPEKRLISGALCDGHQVCAVGAYLWWQHLKAGMSPEEAWDLLPTLEDEGLHETAEFAAAHSKAIKYSVAWDLAYMNDEDWGRCEPEERYEKFLAWIDRKLAA